MLKFKWQPWIAVLWSVFGSFDAVASDNMPVKRHRHPFTQAEDLQLTSLVDHLGTTAWKAISQYLPRHSPRRCRDRWTIYLDPYRANKKLGNFTEEEDDIIITMHFHKGESNWQIIARSLPERSALQCKNRWNKYLWPRIQQTMPQPSLIPMPNAPLPFVLPAIPQAPAPTSTEDHFPSPTASDSCVDEELDIIQPFE
ncbi:MAG: hypothetical protein LBJ77_02585 [Holosporales bacterium]|jgi:hypothetical protein|nr:hypothetical protein [Holosporales bacterium]